MDEYLIQGSTLTNIADAIREKTGDSALMTPAEMVEAIESIQTGGGTLRTTHYHGTLSYNNATVYDMVIPVADILASDMVVVTFRITRSGTVADGVITWNDDLIVPAVLSDSRNRLTVCGKASINFGTANIKYADLSTNNIYSMIAGTCRQMYNKNYGNDVTLTPSIQQGVSITLTPQGYNGKLCVSGVATEYEYDVYIMTVDGNAIIMNGG